MENPKDINELLADLEARGEKAWQERFNREEDYSDKGKFAFLYGYVTMGIRNYFKNVKI